MFNQIGQDQFSVTRHPTYQNPTHEFLSSFHYYPHRRMGGDRGRNVFRFFGHDYQFNHTKIGDLLGFQTRPNTFTEVPSDIFLQYELDNLWGSITMIAPPYHEMMNSTLIHNPTIRYFHMGLAQIFFGKSENTDAVSKEELYIMFSVFQSRPVSSATFLLVNLDAITNSTK